MPKEVRTDRHIGALARREAYLGELIAQGQANSFDRAEYAALRWAVPILERLNPPKPTRQKDPEE